MKNSMTTIVLAVTIGGILASGAASAQSAKAGDRETLEEVVVTASKRLERITDVPYAVTAVGGKEIEDRGVMDIKELQFSVPGLAMNDSYTQGADRIQLRGVDAGSGTGLPTVGVYIDDVGNSIDQQQRTANVPLVDIERIEVLRGPQGTLYGQGSVSGTIRYITRNPSLTDTDGYADATVYSQQDGGTGYRANAAVSLPIAQDKAGVRLVGGYDKRAGWIDYPNVGVKDANGTDTVFVRGKLLWNITDKVRTTLLYQYTDQDSDSGNLSGAYTATSSPDFDLFPVTDKSHLVNLILDFDLGFGTLTSATGYVDRNYYFRGGGSGIGFPPHWLIDFDTDYTQTTEELRLVSNEGGRLRYVVGGWYRKFDSDGSRLVSGAPPFLDFLNRTGTDPVNSKAYAFFGDATWAFTSQLEASVGLRYYSDDRESITVTPAPSTVKASFSSTSPRFNLLYKWNESVSSYLTASKGFRSGGFNFDDSAYDAESLWNYEAGTKATLLEDRVYLDAAFYYLDYKNRQSNNLVGVYAVTTNGGEASGPGLEFALSSKLPAGMGLDLSASWNDVRYDVTTFENDKGERFAYVPPVTASVSLHQRFPLGSSDLRGLWRVDYQYADGFYVVVRTQDQTGARVTFFETNTQSQTLLNLSAGVETDRWAVTVSAQNLLNEDAVVFPVVYQTGAGVRVRPRSYLLNLRYNW